MKDWEIKARISMCKRRAEELYDPKKSFGNIKLLEVIAQSQIMEKLLEETIECPECEGEGREPHECNCDKCDFEGDDCPDCEDGRILKN